MPMRERTRARVARRHFDGPAFEGADTLAREEDRTRVGLLPTS